MQLIVKEIALEKLKEQQNTFNLSLTPIQVAMYEGLLIAEDVVRAIPPVPENVETGIPYDRLLVLAKAMYKWIDQHSFDGKREFNKIGITAKENKTLGYVRGITISAIDGK